jgi:hypothetical protein
MTYNANTILRLATAALVSGLLSFFIAAPARPQTVATPVSYAETASLEAARDMLGRINRAPNQICQPRAPRGAGIPDWRACDTWRASVKPSRLDAPTDSGSAAVLVFLAERERR